MANTDLLAAIQQRNPAQVALAIGRGTQPNAHDARGYTPFHVALLTADASTAQALLDGGADQRVITKLAQGRSMGAKTLVAYRHGRAHAHSPGSREREAEFATCEALNRLLNERGVEATLDDTHWWMKGVEDAADLAARQGRPWKAAG
ncbi:ankyrin repeat domain-containing protein [Stenotrophomonas maltophilia]|uniref:hypothetical protein n=1 Tax=Stenotrophomonas maltophilia TaxID=40324 RepID=UPI0015DF76FE|nr:hypothetical protein [Stenotrophomonas maltophilia]MBA0282766.1 ankyrin repeat domain-containing protein [Stenotrophomonas maltophilia]MBA0345945.1 ankyrin repeat domain-containing protein [Stenotrophomonas maltophilia]MBA0359086.1 ankyrin repeat domain-containing protein [Stenotrophomonas maltophilia]MBA0521173.1 ankyrin repeat domain-containing protein [Stenotrophomonas maltophilia]